MERLEQLPADIRYPLTNVCLVDFSQVCCTGLSRNVLQTCGPNIPYLIRVYTCKWGGWILKGTYRPSCGLHRSATAWTRLSPAELFHSCHHGLALPRSPVSHAFVSFFSRFLLSHRRGSKATNIFHGRSFIGFPMSLNSRTENGGCFFVAFCPPC